jgi:hypothetical protein
MRLRLDDSHSTVPDHKMDKEDQELPIKARSVQT